jgi:hypothetical protein
MGRDTSIYMIDKKKTANLYEHLQNKVYHTGTFKNLLNTEKEIQYL